MLPGLIRGSGGAQAGKRAFSWLCCTHLRSLSYPSCTHCGAPASPLLQPGQRLCGGQVNYSFHAASVREEDLKKIGCDSHMAAPLAGKACW